MMDPFKVLMAEHDNILRGLGLLDAVADRLASGEADAPEQMRTIVRFIERYADACHHAKEENVLFVALEAAGMPRHGGPVAVMLAEHDQGRGLIRRVTSALDAGPDDYSSAVEAARGFSNLLQNHIAKENEILFMMGRNLIPTSKDPEIIAAYDKYEASAVPAAEKRELLASLDTLAAAVAG